jgi:tripartite-type tricarboxylate transporter receptor subunit TctC
MDRRRLLHGASAVLIGYPYAGSARSQQSYPSRPVTIVVPFAAGGSSDTVTRIIAERLAQRMKGAFVVENRVGAAGNTGTASASRAPADGYTLSVGTTATHGVNPSIYRSMPYDHIKDFAPISLVATVPNVLLVNPDTPVRSVADLVSLLKREPDKHTFGSAGAGTSQHMCGELFKLAANVQAIHVPYRASGQIINDLLAKQITFAFDNTTVAWPHVEAGTLRVLATATPERLPFAKDLPTLSETYPGFAATAWQGFFAPAATPREIVDQVSRELQAILREPEVMDRLKRLGITPVGSTSAEFGAFVAQETARWRDVATRANIKVE